MHKPCDVGVEGVCRVQVGELRCTRVEEVWGVQAGVLRIQVEELHMQAGELYDIQAEELDIPDEEVCDIQVGEVRGA